MKRLVAAFSLAVALAGCGSSDGQASPGEQPASQPASQPLKGGDAPVSLEVPPGHAVATFAGGCFWCMEKPFDQVEGVVATISGYAGGQQKDPTYEQVSAGTTGHAEVIRVVYDPKKVDYAKLLDVFWRNIDPTVKNRQFCDVGSQYRTAVYFHDEAQKALAEQTKAKVAGDLKQPVFTEIEPMGDFYPAEGYHQDFYVKNPGRYQSYRTGCGRDRRLEELWGPQAKH